MQAALFFSECNKSLKNSSAFISLKGRWNCSEMRICGQLERFTFPGYETYAQLNVMKSKTRLNISTAFPTISDAVFNVKTCQISHKYVFLMWKKIHQGALSQVISYSSVWKCFQTQFSVTPSLFVFFVCLVWLEHNQITNEA